MTTDSSSIVSSSARAQASAPSWAPRLGAIGVGLLLNLVYVLIVTKGIGYDLKTPSVFGQPAQPIQIGSVIGASLVVPLLGWGLLALLERFVPRRAALIWGVIAGLVLVIGLPYNGVGITVTDQVLLAVMHLVVGAVIIPTFVITSLRRRRTASS